MTWFSRRVRRKQLDRQLDKELRFHIDQHAADLIARGLEPVEAHRRAQLELGGFEQVKEGCRDARGTRWVDDLQQDLRYAWRTLRRRPFFTAVIVGTLALGGGATTLMFTVINSVLLRPVPYPDPHRLLVVREETDYSTQYGNQWAFAYPNYLDCKRDVRTLTLGAWRVRRGTLSSASEPEFVVTRQVSSELFPILGAALVHGRTFVDAEDLRRHHQPCALAATVRRKRGGAGEAARVRWPTVHGHRCHRSGVRVFGDDRSLHANRPGCRSALAKP
jgi:putative ABC transport system permease protein